MELAAVVVAPGKRDIASLPEIQAASSPNCHPLNSRMPILGNDVLRSWTERIRKLGVQSLWLTSNVYDESKAFSELARLAEQGIERMLVIRLKSYAEMDLSDLLRFHCDTRNSVTEAYDDRGALGVSLFERGAIPVAAGESESSGVGQETGWPGYQFQGYAKRILSAKERQELVKDGLTGACLMRPLGGIEIRENVWVGQGASLAMSARVLGPAYIGARTIVRPGATIGPFASVERDCVVDCGTTVERSTVLPHTYLAPGLLVRNALVEGGYLEDLNCGTVVDLESAGLGGGTRYRASRSGAFSDASVYCRENAAATLGFVPPSAASSSQPWNQVQL